MKPRLILLVVALACSAKSAEIQGVVIDRNCAADMLKNGRAETLKNRRECSLAKNYVRDGYGIITTDNHFFKFDDGGNKKVLGLLQNTPGKDDLKVIATGNIQGDTIKVAVISML